MIKRPLSGVYAAAVTPLNQDQSIALEDIPPFLAFLAERGCHGALLLGTTGEGPSFAIHERLAIFEAAMKVKEVHPDFRLLAGTGTPSLEETIILSKSAFDLGFQGVVVLPPYYFHQASEEGLFTWFQEVIQRAVPQDGTLLGYHFPAQSGVPIPLGVIARLHQAFPQRFGGFKDSTPEAEYAYQIGKHLDVGLTALVGNDKHLSPAMEAGASGCITALANLYSPTLRRVWDAYHHGKNTGGEQEVIEARRVLFGRYMPFPAAIKAALAVEHGFPTWAVRPPLTSLLEGQIEKMVQELRAL